MDKNGLSETNEELLELYTRLYKSEEKKLNRCYKMISAYTNKVHHHIKYCNEYNAKVNSLKEKLKSKCQK